MLVTAVLIATSQIRAGEAPPATADIKKVAQTFYSGVNVRNYESMAKAMADNFVDHNPEPGQAAGSFGVQKAFEQMFKVVPDLKIQVQQMVAEGDTVVTRLFMVGTAKGDFMGITGIPATGKSFRIGGIDMLKVKSGKAVERWGYFDTAALQQQLAPAKK
jgi:steroid delta-isomerase-like uncharacterized protein